MWLELLIGLLVLILLAYFHFRNVYKKWEYLGVTHSHGIFPFGSYNFLSGEHLDVMSGKDHNKFSSQKYFGWFMLDKPILAINDVELLKQIQVKDFKHFVNRQSSIQTKNQFPGGELDKVSLAVE